MQPARQDPDRHPWGEPRYSGASDDGAQVEAVSAPRRIEEPPALAMMVAPAVGLGIWGLLIWGGLVALGI